MNAWMQASIYILYIFSLSYISLLVGYIHVSLIKW